MRARHIIHEHACHELYTIRDRHDNECRTLGTKNSRGISLPS